MDEILAGELSRAESRRRLRMLKDRLFGVSMGVGGVAVIGTLLLIFLYLLYVVFPLFVPARVATLETNTIPLAADPAFVAFEEYGEVGLAVGGDGTYSFFATADGAAIAGGALVPAGARATTVRAGGRIGRTLAVGLADGSVVVAKPGYVVSFPDDRRKIAPAMNFPVGEAPIPATGDGSAVQLLAAETADEQTTVVAWSAAGRLVLTHLSVTVNMLEDEKTLEKSAVEVPIQDKDLVFLSLNSEQTMLLAAAANGHVSYYDIRDKAKPALVERILATEAGKRITAVEPLAGGVSFLVGDSGGRISQWFQVRDRENNLRFKRIRSFSDFSAPVVAIEPEYARKGFAALDASGRLAIYHTTSERMLVDRASGVPGARLLAYTPRADGLGVIGAERRLGRLAVKNDHPEVSWRALWGQVWYESRNQPEFIWQSSSAASDFEPKFSLTPLVFGTIKAAFYACFFAVPIAIFGAVYTAYFMSPRLRTVIKPSIEIMAALPTVILGFLAGLWLAPLVELHLAGIFLAIFCLPVSMIAASLIWNYLPSALRHRVPAGTEAMMLLPVVGFVIWASMNLSAPMETAWFGGNLPMWLNSHFGWTYDQRNSLVVGVAMGFAVIPNIYSISEDAVFSVPQHLTNGSLALGATPWQTVTRVVLLTASPGIFSAVMIGLGRAVGETMIVLMSTGNTPVMDFSIFKGFRALSANIAVEMPESAVGSTHYRVLFLAALVLFMITFAFNTVAEIVRQRLRVRYGNL